MCRTRKKTGPPGPSSLTRAAPHEQSAGADAPPPPTQPKANHEEAKRLAELEDEVKRLGAKKAQDAGAEEMRKARLLAEYHDQLAAAAGAFKTARWEYDLADVREGEDKAAFARFQQKREDAGWEFLGSTTGGPSGGRHHWLFRRPVRAGQPRAANRPPGGLGVQDLASAMLGRSPPAGNQDFDGLAANLLGRPLPGAAPDASNRPGPLPGLPPPAGGGDDAGVAPNLNRPSSSAKPDDASIQAEIDRLTERLKTLRPKAGRVEFPKDALPLDPEDTADLLTRLAERRYGKDKVTVSSDSGVVVEGGKEALEWAALVVRSLRAN